VYPRHAAWFVSSIGLMAVHSLRIAARPSPTRHLALSCSEPCQCIDLYKAIHALPHCVEATKRFVGTVDVILNTNLLFTPIPLSNVVPAPLRGFRNDDLLPCLRPRALAQRGLGGG
jgi:hypothetical protein